MVGASTLLPQEKPRVSPMWTSPDTAVLPQAQRGPMSPQGNVHAAGNEVPQLLSQSLI